MIDYLKKLFHKEPVIQAESQSVKDVDLTGMHFEDLHNNFDKRTSMPEQYSHHLAISNPRLLHWISSVDYSGYTRERSLRYLIEHYEPGDENRILLRLEDWVPQVQRLAQTWVRQHFSELTLQELNNNYRLLLYLLRKERLRQDPIMSVITTDLLAKLQHATHQEFATLHPRFRRYFYRLAGHEYAVLREWMGIDRDPFNRILLMHCYGIQALTAQECTRLQGDKSAFVRRAFLKTLLQHSPVPSQQDLQDFCFDPNPGIRAYARFYLAKLYQQEAYDLYVQQQNLSFYYIADYAKKEDVSHFLQGLSLTNPRLKYLCLQAICRIDPAQLRQLPLEELLAENRRIRRLLCEHLPHIVPIEQLLDLKPLFAEVSQDGVHTYLNLIYRKSFWHFLDEAFTVLLQEPSERHVTFIHRKFSQKPYIYQQLPDGLGHQLAQKMSQLHPHEQDAVGTLVNHIHFAIRTAGYTLV